VKLASYLWQSRHGIFYTRFKRGGIEIRRSLGTRDPSLARFLAYSIGAAMIDPKKLLEQMHAGNVKDWTLKTNGNDLEITTDGSEADHARALEALALALQSRQPPQPQTLITTPVNTAWTLDKCVSDYMEERVDEFSAGTMRTYRSSFKKLMSGLGSTTPIQQIDSTVFVKFRKVLDATGHPDTIVRDCGAWRGLFEWAIRRNRYSGQNPIENAQHSRSMRARLVAEREEPHNPFSADDLQKIFEPSRYVFIKKPCAYWLPVIALFTGARLGELCSLRKNDFYEYKTGHWSIKITDSKTVNGIREIPLHHYLIESGLIQYITDVESAWPGCELIFPYLKPAAKNGYANLPGRDFSLMKQQIGLSSDKVFHSFRKTLVSCLQYNGCTPEARKVFVGHDAGDSRDVHAVYSQAKLDPARLAELIFPFLDFTKWPGFTIPQISYDRHRFDEYMMHMKRKQIIDAARAERVGRTSKKSVMT
jgi:integrase